MWLRVVACGCVEGTRESCRADALRLAHSGAGTTGELHLPVAVPPSFLSLMKQGLGRASFFFLVAFFPAAPRPSPTPDPTRLQFVAFPSRPSSSSDPGMTMMPMQLRDRHQEPTSATIH